MPTFGIVKLKNEFEKKVLEALLIRHKIFKKNGTKCYKICHFTQDIRYLPTLKGTTTLNANEYEMQAFI